MDRTGGRAEFLRNGPSSKIRLYSGINAPATSLQGQFYPVRFEVIRNALLAITEEMGATLRRAAYSTKIKTRADFSCAFFDADLRAIARPSPSRPRPEPVFKTDGLLSFTSAFPRCLFGNSGPSRALLSIRTHSEKVETVVRLDWPG
jgi:hypothetical protein